MPYTFTTTFGDTDVLAPCLQSLCAEIAASPKYSALTNLGEIGDASHQTQGTSSDHNGFVVGPSQSAHPGKGYVRAVDLGGDAALLLELRAELHAIYLARDPRIWPYGYCKGPDSQIFDWPPGTGFHTDTGDEGHLHISVGIKDPNDPGGWIPALDSTAPWGIAQEEDMPLTPADADLVVSHLMGRMMDDVGFHAPLKLILGNTLKNATTAAGATAAVNALKVSVDQLTAAVQSSGGGSTAAADAAAIVTELARRLQGA